MDLHYNHRSILKNEVVFDFDDGNIQENYEEVKQKLIQDKISFEAFKNVGSKKGGIRLHTFWKMDNIKSKSLMKKLILKHYAYGKGIDYQLCGKHLIRAEYGLYEKEYGKEIYNELICSNKILNIFGEEEPNMVIQEIIDKYSEYQRQRAIKSYARTSNISVNNEVIDKLLNSKIMVEDCRERILFFLIHQLKNKYEMQELSNMLINWYKYNGGCKLTSGQIRWKVKYHWDRDYTFSPFYLKNLIGDIK